MNYLRSAVFFSAVFYLAGCAWFGLSKNAVGNKQDSGEVVAADSFVKAGKVIDAPRLKKGGKLLVIPFPAGVNVVANERSDKIALMIVKGIADQLKESRFQVLNDQNAHEADLIVMGHVTADGAPSKWDQWFLRKARNAVGVEGRIADAASNAAVLIFAHSAQASGRREDHAQLGYDIGRDIGRFIVSSAD